MYNIWQVIAMMILTGYSAYIIGKELEYPNKIKEMDKINLEVQESLAGMKQEIRLLRETIKEYLS